MTLGPVTGTPGLLAKPQHSAAALLALAQAGHLPLPSGAGWQVLPKGAGFVLRLSPADTPPRDIPVTPAQVAQLAQGQANLHTILAAAPPAAAQTTPPQDQAKTPEGLTTAPAAQQGQVFGQSYPPLPLPFGAPISPDLQKHFQHRAGGNGGQRQPITRTKPIPPIGAWVLLALFLLLLAAAML